LDIPVFSSRLLVEQYGGIERWVVTDGTDASAENIYLNPASVELMPFDQLRRKAERLRIYRNPDNF
jgi:hypothetical protein